MRESQKYIARSPQVGRQWVDGQIDDIYVSRDCSPVSDSGQLSAYPKYCCLMKSPAISAPKRRRRSLTPLRTLLIWGNSLSRVLADKRYTGSLPWQQSAVLSPASEGQDQPRFLQSGRLRCCSSYNDEHGRRCRSRRAGTDSCRSGNRSDGSVNLRMILPDNEGPKPPICGRWINVAEPVWK